MKNLINFLAICFLCQITFAQVKEKKIKGRVENDSIKVENVIVFNSHSRTGGVVQIGGEFEIQAKEKDTLIFSSLSFKTKKIVITDDILNEPILIVKLEIFTRQLNEVVVAKAKKPVKAAVSENTQKYVDQKYFDDNQSSPKNKNVYDGSIENGADFVRLYKDIMKLLIKKHRKQTDFFSNVDFTEAVLKKVSYSFYTKTLKLKDEEIRLFLLFCENDDRSKLLLKNKYEFELMDFMVVKNKEFQKSITVRK